MQWSSSILAAFLVIGTHIRPSSCLFRPSPGKVPNAAFLLETRETIPGLFGLNAFRSKVAGIPPEFSRLNVSLISGNVTASLSSVPQPVPSSFSTRFTAPKRPTPSSLLYLNTTRASVDYISVDGRRSTPHPPAAGENGGSTQPPTPPPTGTPPPPARAQKARAVFAHFMVSNVPTWDISKWLSDITLAQAAHIDAFALNIAFAEGDEPQIANAFKAAEEANFKLFFSFDYAGNGPWPASSVVNLVNQYSGSPAYFHWQSKPFVSTFEGPGAVGDWDAIKSQTSCFFVPDWSSLGAKAAISSNSPDGLFSWAAWPYGHQKMDTYVDASYFDFLSRKSPDKVYMMPVSPWFYTNMPGFNKNWMWKGDDLWRDRWEQVFFADPDFVQIISWNDYGESHYIGPLHDESMKAFGKMYGNTPFNYVNNMPHDGWRAMLPYWIDTYKYGKAPVSNEVLMAWYRPNPKDACSNGQTTGNTASQLQLEYSPAEVVEDKIFVSALLTGTGSVTVLVGDASFNPSWTNIPEGGIGVYHGSVSYDGATGPVVVTVSGPNGQMTLGSGPGISTSCSNTNGYNNWNAWVGSVAGSSLGQNEPVPLRSTFELKCVEGHAPGTFAGLCSYTCKYGYCPISACVCTKVGNPPPAPAITAGTGYPAVGRGSSYDGLCKFTCARGYCPSDVCDYQPHLLIEPTVSPFLPGTCNAGSGQGIVGGLCDYSCNFGYCPINSCTCTRQGGLNLPPPITNDVVATPVKSWDDGLCAFACTRGYCPRGGCYRPADYFRPPSVNYFTALGDSFSAGPGAGRPWDPSDPEPDCKRTNNAYPPVLSSLKRLDNNHFDFLSCSGHTTQDLLDSQVGHVDGKTNLVTLSIGGNDLNFVQVLESCVSGIPKQKPCSEAIQDARNTLFTVPRFSQNWRTIMNDIVQNTNWKDTGSSRGTLVYQTLYAPFFDAYTDQCNNINWAPRRYGGAPMGYQLMPNEQRTLLNTLTEELNYVIQSFITEYNGRLGISNTENVPFVARLVDQNPKFAEHRFCRHDVKELDADNKEHFYFEFDTKVETGQVGPSLTDQQYMDLAANPNCTTDAKGDWGKLYQCAIGNALVQDVSLRSSNTLQPGYDNAHVFHPKSKGHLGVALAVSDVLSERTPAHRVPWRLVAIGDQLTIGSGGYRYGFRRYIHDQLQGNAGRYFVEWVGTQSEEGSPLLDPTDTEAYDRQVISQIRDNVAQHPSLLWNWNHHPDITGPILKTTVLVMAGTNDMLSPDPNINDPDAAAQKLKGLIDDVLSACPVSWCNIYLAHIPMIGQYKEPGPNDLPFIGTQKRTAMFNARISVMVNEYRAQSLPVTLVRTTASTSDHAGVDDLLNDFGYRVIAENFVDAIFAT